jgi:hypothetical protein
MPRATCCTSLRAANKEVPAWQREDDAKVAIAATIEPLESLDAGDKLRLAEFVERRLGRVELVVEVLGLGLEIEEAGHHLTRRPGAL